AGGAAAGAAGGAGLPEGLNFSDPRQLLDPEARKHIPQEILDSITSALSSSIVHTFAWAILPAAIALVFSFFMGSGRMDPQEVARQEQEHAAAMH
ncbi:hypothetical protein BN871_DZ_00010, partial [Paenibacillus sp. P22]